MDVNQQETPIRFEHAYNGRHFEPFLRKTFNVAIESDPRRNTKLFYQQILFD